MFFLQFVHGTLVSDAGAAILSCVFSADGSFVSLMLQTWPLLSLSKTQLTASYLTQHIIETAGVHCLLYACC